LIFTPFHFPPRGKGFDTPPPLGEGWEGGNLPIKSNKFFRLKICYHYCEELHCRQPGDHKIRHKAAQREKQTTDNFLEINFLHYFKLEG
jgi:hypothetical protein